MHDGEDTSMLIFYSVSVAHIWELEVHTFSTRLLCKTDPGTREEVLSQFCTADEGQVRMH